MYSLDAGTANTEFTIRHPFIVVCAELLFFLGGRSAARRRDGTALGARDYLRRAEWRRWLAALCVRTERAIGQDAAIGSATPFSCLFHERKQDGILSLRVRILLFSLARFHFNHKLFVWRHKNCAPINFNFYHIVYALRVQKQIKDGIQKKSNQNKRRAPRHLPYNVWLKFKLKLWLRLIMNVNRCRYVFIFFASSFWVPSVFAVRHCSPCQMRGKKMGWKAIKQFPFSRSFSSPKVLLWFRFASTIHHHLRSLETVRPDFVPSASIRSHDVHFFYHKGSNVSHSRTENRTKREKVMSS